MPNSEWLQHVSCYTICFRIDSADRPTFQSHTVWELRTPDQAEDFVVLCLDDRRPGSAGMLGFWTLDTCTAKTHTQTHTRAHTADGAASADNTSVECNICKYTLYDGLLTNICYMSTVVYGLALSINNMPYGIMAYSLFKLRKLLSSRDMGKKNQPLCNVRI